jgi:hypothetical protein
MCARSAISIQPYEETEPLQRAPMMDTSLWLPSRAHAKPPRREELYRYDADAEHASIQETLRRCTSGFHREDEHE